MRALQGRGHTLRIVTYPAGRDVDDLVTPCDCPSGRPGRPMPVGSSRRKLLLGRARWPPRRCMPCRVSPAAGPYHPRLSARGGAAGVDRGAGLLACPRGLRLPGQPDRRDARPPLPGPNAPFLPALQRMERWIDRQPQATGGTLAARRRFAGVPWASQPAASTPCPTAWMRLASRRARNCPATCSTGCASGWPCPPAAPLLVYLGLLAPYQGTDLLLRAMQRLSSVNRRRIYC